MLACCFRPHLNNQLTTIIRKTRDFSQVRAHCLIRSMLLQMTVFMLYKWDTMPSKCETPPVLCLPPLFLYKPVQSVHTKQSKIVNNILDELSVAKSSTDLTRKAAPPWDYTLALLFVSSVQVVHCCQSRL